MTMRPHSGAGQRPGRSTYGSTGGSAYRGSPVKKDQKHVVFQLVDPEDPRIQARLPMRVMISQHDTTDSIITTIKNFYGLYEYGVSFENKEGFSIIAAYDNFENDMTVFVRTISPPPSARGDDVRDSASPKKPSLGAPFEMRPPPIHTGGYTPSLTAARSAGARSLSPRSDHGRRSASAVPGGKPRMSRTKSKENSVAGDAEGYSSGDNGEGSVTSSRRSKTEQVNAEISVDNIVEGGRRKRAFESSELPLFVPPQVPMTASISSISPQRRTGPPNIASPYAFNNQQTFSYTQPLPSPQSYGNAAQAFPTPLANGGFQQPNKRHRPSVTYPPARYSSGGILPTPDPTVGSVISDEDVALQLMRLGDPAAFSHGRTSTSTVDDALSGKAEAAMSDEEDEDEDDADSDSSGFKDSAGPQKKKPRLMGDMRSYAPSGDDFDGVSPDAYPQGQDGQRKSKALKISGKPRAGSMVKPKTKSMDRQQVPMSPSSLPAPSRKPSISSSINFQHQLAEDEEDLSSKPRCQRCRKSKKGCDRQRPCGRCKDAGIGIEGCISEDEGNGRKGRYGRHMGVPVKKTEETLNNDEQDDDVPMAAGADFFLAPALPDKNRKRKR